MCVATYIYHVKEIKDIIEAYHAALSQGKQTALATIVHLQGSAYRRPGGRMLVTDSGQLTGAISGGCLEGDALRKAQLAMAQQQPMLVTYDTTDDDDNVLGVGLGCNGIISIVIEPIDALTDNNAIQLLQRSQNERQPSCMVTLFSLNKRATQPGSCLLVQPGLVMATNAVPPYLLHSLRNIAGQVLTQQQSTIEPVEGTGGLMVFAEWLAPPLSVLVFGAGNDCIPLVKMANLLGWETTVVDGRPNYANRQRFAAATNIVLAKPGDAFNQLTIDNRTVALLMTHNYHYDFEILRKIVSTPVSYIGLLGPKKKQQMMADQLAREGVILLPQQQQLIYGPAGIDIGSETPEEIALAIIAEIKAVTSKRNGTFLRDKQAAIHHEEQLREAPLPIK